MKNKTVGNLTFLYVYVMAVLIHLISLGRLMWVGDNKYLVQQSYKL